MHQVNRFCVCFSLHKICIQNIFDFFIGVDLVKLLRLSFMSREKNHAFSSQEKIFRKW